MSRMSSGDVITVKPQSNVYTVLVIAAVMIEIVGVVAVAMRYHAMFPKLNSYLFF